MRRRGAGIEFIDENGGGSAVRLAKAGRWKNPESERHVEPGKRGFDEVASGSYIASCAPLASRRSKNKLGEYVRLAAGGETVLVTDRDRVVAEIGPPTPPEARWFRTRYCWTPSGKAG